MDTCAKCGAGLGVGRFCLNCGHRIGAPVPVEVPVEAPAEEAAQQHGIVATERPSELRVRRRLTEPPARAQPFATEDRPDVAERESDWRPGTDVDDDDSSPRLHWAAWVLAALSLLCAVLLALSFLTDDDTTGGDDPGAAASGAAGETSGEPTPSGARRDLSRDATVSVPATAPATTDLDGSLVPYDAERMLDGDPTTAWRMVGDGTGAEIRLTLPQPALVDRVGLVNGYAKTIQGVDWYPNNRRILAVRWTFEDGTSVEQSLVEAPRIQRMKIEPVTTSTVTLTLLTVTPPAVGPLGRDYTAISTVELTGRPTG